MRRASGMNCKVTVSLTRCTHDAPARCIASRSNSLYFTFVKKQIILRKNEEHRILAGHQWVFSNEIKSINGTPEAGDVIELLRHDEKLLGVGFYNPHSLIAFRLLSRELETGDAKAAERGARQAGEHAQESGLTGAIGADQCDEFAFINGKIQPTQNGLGAETFYKLADFNDHRRLFNFSFNSARCCW